MSTIELKNISKSFGSVEVIKDVSLSAEDGEFVVFVGPSGCGKSTLLPVLRKQPTELFSSMVRTSPRLIPIIGICRWFFNPMRSIRI